MGTCNFRFDMSLFQSKIIYPCFKIVNLCAFPCKNNFLQSILYELKFFLSQSSGALLQIQWKLFDKFVDFRCFLLISIRKQEKTSKKTRKTSEKQGFRCAAPKSWSKYTTCICKILNVSLPCFNFVSSISTLISKCVASIRILLIQRPEDWYCYLGGGLNCVPVQGQVKVSGVDPGLLGGSNSHWCNAGQKDLKEGYI